MSQLHFVAGGEASISVPYIVSCHACERQFDTDAALWCICDLQTRTLVCPNCGSCFCNAPLPYKRRFWNDAPRFLREHASRFRVRRQSVPGQTRSGTDKEPVQPRVLVVDDDEAMRSVVACYAEQLGYSVDTSSNATDALRMADAVSYDVVITDALMPGMDGREMCRLLKGWRGDSIKVILMSSLYKANHFRREAKLTFKADEFLAKPMRFDELKAALERCTPIGPAGG